MCGHLKKPSAPRALIAVVLLLLAIGALSASADGARGGGRPAPTFAGIKEYRQREGLDLDLVGHPREIDARIRGLLKAWREGDKWARSTASVWGAPLTKADRKLMSYRQKVLRIWGDQFEPWLARHPEAAATYAGYYGNPEDGGWIYVGFTAEEGAWVAKMKSELHLLGPGLIRPFPEPPTYTEAELEGLAESLGEDESLWKLMSSIGVETEANKVSIMTTNIAKLRAKITELFGPGLPIEFEYGKVVPAVGGG